MLTEALRRTIEKLQFSLPAVFTIGPLNEPNALKQYAMLLTGNADGSPAKKVMTQTGRSHVQDIVKGPINPGKIQLTCWSKLTRM